MEDLFSNILTSEVIIVATIVGGVQETLKQVIKAGFNVDSKGAVFRTIMGTAPMGLGALFGHLIISEGGVAEPWAMGMVAGAIASKVYDTIAPTAKTIMAARQQEDGTP